MECSPDEIAIYSTCGTPRMSKPSILPPDDDTVSFPSMPTLRGGGASSPGEPVLGRIDHYDLLRKLGGGGFGVVYLARDTASGLDVAIKTLHPLLKHDPEEMEHLRGKFALASRLAHPNIATALTLHPVRDIDIPDETARTELRLSPGDRVMIMRYAPGITLSRWRRQFPDGIVPPGPTIDIARQLASALDYAHSEQIVHRDVKPGNVMVETLAAPEAPPESDHGNGRARPPGAPQNGAASRPDEPPLVTRHPSLVTPKLRVRLVDFGLAAEIRSSMVRLSAETGDTSGTRPYMAPEQWAGRKQDGRTDQYALACMLYELLSGEPPFAGVFETGDPAVMALAVEGRSPEPIEAFSPRANAAFAKALAKKPGDRFPSCAAFVEALAAGLGLRSATGSKISSLPSPSLPSFDGIRKAISERKNQVSQQSRQVLGRFGSGLAGGCQRIAPRARLLLGRIGTNPVVMFPRRHPRWTIAGVLAVSAIACMLLLGPEPDVPGEGASLRDLIHAKREWIEFRKSHLQAKYQTLANGVIPDLDLRIQKAWEAYLASILDHAAKMEESLQGYARWRDEGLFKVHFTGFDAALRELKALSTSDPRPKRADELSSELESAARWIQENSPKRRRIEAKENTLATTLDDLRRKHGDRLDTEVVARIEESRKRADDLRDEGLFEEAETQYDDAIALVKVADDAELRRREEAARRAELEKELANLKDRAETAVSGAKPYLKWTDKPYADRNKTMKDDLAAIRNLRAAEDVAQAKELLQRMVETVNWMKDHAPARASFDESRTNAEKGREALLDDFKVPDLTEKDLEPVDTAIARADALRDNGDYAAAQTACGEAIRLLPEIRATADNRKTERKAKEEERRAAEAKAEALSELQEKVAKLSDGVGPYAGWGDPFYAARLARFAEATNEFARCVSSGLLDEARSAHGNAESLAEEMRAKSGERRKFADAEIRLSDANVRIENSEARTREPSLCAEADRLCTDAASLRDKADFAAAVETLDKALSLYDKAVGIAWAEKIAALVAQSRDSWAASRWGDSLRSAEEALRCDPSNRDAIALRDQAKTLLQPRIGDRHVLRLADASDSKGVRFVEFPFVWDGSQWTGEGPVTQGQWKAVDRRVPERFYPVDRDKPANYLNTSDIDAWMKKFSARSECVGWTFSRSFFDGTASRDSLVRRTDKTRFQLIATLENP